MSDNGCGAVSSPQAVISKVRRRRRSAKDQRADIHQTHIQPFYWSSQSSATYNLIDLVLGLLLTWLSGNYNHQVILMFTSNAPYTSTYTGIINHHHHHKVHPCIELHLGEDQYLEKRGFQDLMWSYFLARVIRRASSCIFDLLKLVDQSVR